jgi:DNA phosphorothioation-dependent restriction protein DptG
MTIEPAKVNWWYESVVDWMLAHPDKTKKDCAEFFNVTPQWIYVLTQSDVFKALLAKRRESHNAMVSGTVIEKVEALAELSLDVLTEEFAKSHQSGTMTMTFARDTADMALTKMGYTGKDSGAKTAPVQVNFFQATPQVLEEARHMMTSLGSNGAAPEIPIMKDITPAKEDADA